VWPHTTDPRDAGAAKRITIDPGGGLPTQFVNLPSAASVSFTLPYTVPGTYIVTAYASTSQADPVGTAIAETAVLQGVTPATLPGPEVPDVVLGRVVPELPHFRFPFSRDEFGSVRMAEHRLPGHPPRPDH
jgi:hypothetical protein